MYRTWSKKGNTIESSNDCGHYYNNTLISNSVEGPFFTFGILLLHHSYSNTFMAFLISIIILVAINPISVLLQIYELSIKSAHHPTLRVLEIAPKFVCHKLVKFVTIICVIFFFLLLYSEYSKVVGYSRIASLVFSLSILVLLLFIIYVFESIPRYCCQLIPVCI